MCLLISMAAAAESAGEKKRVVVIGGGVAGSVVAKSLQFCADVVLIDEKEYFEIPWGSLRAMVEPSFAERSVINHSDYLPNVRIVASTAANITEREVLTTDGRLLVYEYLVIATGHKEAVPKTRAERLSQYAAGSSWLRGTIVQNNLDMQGRLMVDENLRVMGHKNIFAVGDITDVKEIKQGYLAQRHAEVTAKNLKLLLMGGNESKMATYKPGLDIALVSLGRKEGVAQFPLLTISGCIPGMIKSGDLYVGKTRKHLGLKP